MNIIYVITNDINNKQYVGKTHNSIEKRFKQHVSDSKRKRCEKRPLYDAMNKYGIEHFHIKELEHCPANEAAEREMYWIEKLDTYHYGYNATLGGDSKHYYNYKEIANKYLELQNLKETAKYFDCDTDTVRVACCEYNIDILSSAEVTRNKSKNVLMLPEGKIFNSTGEAAKYLFENNLTDKNKYLESVQRSILRVCQHERGTAYGHKWEYVED